MYKKHTEEEWARALEMFQEGFGPTIISRTTGIDERELRRRYRQYEMTGVWYTGRKTNIRSNAELKKSVIKAVEQQSLSLDEVPVKYGISRGCLRSWLHKFRHGGYEELLATKPRGRLPKMSKPKRRRKEPSEVERLREEVAYLKAENAYLKKLKALDQEENAEMFGIGPMSSEN
jgi:transposase